MRISTLCWEYCFRQSSFTSTESSSEEEPMPSPHRWILGQRACSKGLLVISRWLTLQPWKQYFRFLFCICHFNWFLFKFPTKQIRAAIIIHVWVLVKFHDLFYSCLINNKSWQHIFPSVICQWISHLAYHQKRLIEKCGTFLDFWIITCNTPLFFHHVAQPWNGLQDVNYFLLYTL